MSGYRRHYKTFYGRPKSQVLQMREHATRGRARAQKRRDEAAGRAEAILARLDVGERETLTRWIERREDDFVTAGFLLALDWLLGEGLSRTALERVQKEPWGEELIDPYAAPSAA